MEDENLEVENIDAVEISDEEFEMLEQIRDNQKIVQDGSMEDLELTWHDFLAMSIAFMLVILPYLLVIVFIFLLATYFITNFWL